VLPAWWHQARRPATQVRPLLVDRAAAIRDLIAAHEADPDPLNLLPEIAALRALFQDFIERYETMTAALLAWHASWQITRRPLPEEQLLGFEAVIAEWENALGELGENATDKQRLDLEAARKFVSILRGADAEQRPRQIMDLSTPPASWARSARWSSASRRRARRTRSAGRSSTA
jgi:hypothetical protein